MEGTISIPRIRIIRHSAVPDTGSDEVRFADGRASKYFYFDDVLAPAAAAGHPHQRAALEQAKALARAERDKPT